MTPSTSLTAATAELRAGLLDQLGEEILSVYDRDAPVRTGEPDQWLGNPERLVIRRG